MKSTECNKPPQIVHIAIDIANPASPVNDLFKSFVRACADEIIFDLKVSESNEKPKLLTREQASEYLNCHVETISNFEKRGWLKNYGVGRRKLYSLSELENPQISKYKKAS